MKRWLVPIFMFLLLGAIINVAVAWGLSLGYASGLPGENRRQLSDEMARWWALNTPEGFADRPTVGFRRIHWGREYVGLMDAKFDGDQLLPVASDGVDRYRYGLPCFSMERSASAQVSTGLVVRRHALLIPQGWPWEGRKLPTRSVWPGFAINTVFYALLLWLLFAAPFALRRSRRIRRGLCPKCAYDLRGTPSSASACPECGATVLKAT